MQIAMLGNVAVLNLSVRMRRRAALEPFARLLLISRLLLSSDMLSLDVASRWDRAAEPHHVVCVHKNQTHLFANTIVSDAAVSQKKFSCCGFKPSFNLLCYPWQPLTTITDCNTTRYHNTEQLLEGMTQLLMRCSESWTSHVIRYNDHPAAHSGTCLTVPSWRAVNETHIRFHAGGVIN